MRGPRNARVGGSLALALVGAAICATPAAAADDFTGVKTCSGDNTYNCPYAASVPVGVGLVSYEADYAADTACAAPVRVPIGTGGDEVVVCEKSPPSVYGTQVTFVRIRSGDYEAAVESRPLYSTAGGYHSYGVRLNEDSAWIATQCQTFYPDSGDPSYCAPDEVLSP